MSNSPTWQGSYMVAPIDISKGRTDGLLLPKLNYPGRTVRLSTLSKYTQKPHTHSHKLHLREILHTSGTGTAALDRALGHRENLL